MVKIKRKVDTTTNTDSNVIPITIVIGVVVLFVLLVVYFPKSSVIVPTSDEIDYPTGITEEGEPFKGEADASIVLVEFSDFRCSHCGTFTNVIDEISDDYIKTGKVKVIYRNFPVIGGRRGPSMDAANAAECVLAQSPELFWRYHDILFGSQSQGEQAYTRSGLSNIAEGIGLNMDEFEPCFNNNQQIDKVLADIRDGEALDVTGTPSVFIGNIRFNKRTADELRDKFDELLAE